MPKNGTMIKVGTIVGAGAILTALGVAAGHLSGGGHALTKQAIATVSASVEVAKVDLNGKIDDLDEKVDKLGESVHNIQLEQGIQTEILERLDRRVP